MPPGLISQNPIDGPPPSPETDPAAAQEVGKPASQVQQLIGGQASGPGMGSPGPDMSGIMVLGQKIEEGLITLAQGAPMISAEMEQCKSILLNALGKFASSSGGGSAPITQAGANFPGAQGGGKPF